MTNLSDFDGPDFADMSQSDFVSVGTFDDYSQILWFNNQTKLQYGVGTKDQEDLIPEAPFPFRRLALAQDFNETGSYIYHQINDSIIAEEFWSEDSRIWLPSVNISIRT